MPEPRRLLIYDGDCGFCTTTAQWVAARAPIDIEPSQRIEDLGAYGLDRDDVAAAAWLVDSNGVHGGDRAIARALLATGWPWSVLGWLLAHAPLRWLGPVAYRLVARNRHRLPGGTPACALDPPAPGVADGES